MTRLVRSENELDDLLAAIARAISSSLGFATVAVHLYRPAWDDFAVTTVHGGADARERLVGDARERTMWEPLLQERFLHDGAYLIPHGEINWETYAPGSYVPAGEPSRSGRRAPLSTIARPPSLRRSGNRVSSSCPTRSASL